MAGYRVLGVLQKTMEYKTRFDRDTIIKRFKNQGFSDELANVFADAYTADDISVARNYLDSKVASNRQKSVEDGRNEWLENTTKSNKAKTPKNQDEILKEISSNQTQFKLIDDSDMTPELKSRLENDGYTLEREPESGVWEVSKGISDQEIKSDDVANSDNLFKKIRDASKKILSTFLGKTSKNNIDGREVKFTKRSLEKMTSGSAVGKSLDNGFTREEHYEAAQNILEIFKTAKFLQTQKPKNGSLDILGVHKYMGEYKNANVKITIKEIKEHGNTFYSIELMELLSRDMQSGDPKTGNLDNTAIIHTGEEPPRPRTSSPYNANTETIPNKSIKEAETMAKTQELQAKADPTQETFDILKIDKNISDEQVETLLKEIEDKNLKVNLPLRDDEALGKAFQKNELGYGRKRLLNLALNEQFLKRHKGFIERAEKTQSKAEFQKFLKENKAEVVEYIKDMVINTLRYIDAYGEGYHFTNKSSLRRANEMILNLESGKNFYFYNHAPNKITNPAPKSHYADKLVDGNEAIQGTYKLSDEIKQDLIKSLKEFVGSRQNLAENIADMQSRWSYKIKEQERLAPSILEGGKKANNGYDKNLLEALKHEQYLLDKFEKKIVKNPQKISSDLEIAKNYLFLKDDTYTKQALDEISQTRQLIEQELNIRPIKEFGTNYAEFYHDGANAIKKLLTEKQGQVAGAFYKDGLGDIDLVWGNKEIGLNKIIEKHSKDFESFGGVEKGLDEIIQKGKNINENGVDTIWYKKGDDYYAIGLSKGFKNKGDNNWVITAYEKKNLSDSQKLKIDKLLNGGDSKTISAYAEIKGSKTPEPTTADNSTTTANKSQELNLSRAERRAMGIEEPKGKTLVIDEKAVKSDVREFGRLADQVGLGFKSAKEAKAVMDKGDKSKFDCGS